MDQQLTVESEFRTNTSFEQRLAVRDSPETSCVLSGTVLRQAACCPGQS